jgi:hypothetical protein
VPASLGLGHRRQDFLEPVEQRRGEVLAAQVRQQQWRGHYRQQDPEDKQQPARRVTENPHGDQIGRNDAQRGQRGDASMGEIRHADDQNQYPQQQHIQSSVNQGKSTLQSLDGICKQGWSEHGD